MSAPWTILPVEDDRQLQHVPAEDIREHSKGRNLPLPPGRRQLSRTRAKTPLEDLSKP